MEIRPEPLDSPAARELIAALDCELLALYPEEGTESHFRLDAEEVAPGRGAFLVARDGGFACGCGAVRLLDARTAEIKRMYVRPERRGRGLGRLLLRALETEARSLGAARVVLESGPRQMEAVCLYRSAGYLPTAAFGEYEESPLSLFFARDL